MVLLLLPAPQLGGTQICLFLTQAFPLDISPQPRPVMSLIADGLCHASMVTDKPCPSTNRTDAAEIVSRP